MEFSLTKQQLAYQKSIVEFAKKELNDDILESDQKGEFSFENWHKCAELGYVGMLIPEEYGGIGESLETTLLCLEALSYGCKDSGLVHAIVTQMCCGAQIMLYGNEKQKKIYLPEIASGKKIAAQALTESDAGSDLGSMQTTAKKNDKKYILSGSKIYIKWSYRRFCYRFCLYR